MPTIDLPTGWYTADDGTRRYWDGAAWLTPSAEAPPAPIAPAPVAPAPAQGGSRRLLIAIAAIVVAVIVVVGVIAFAAKAAADSQAAAAHTAAVKHAHQVAAERAAAAKAAQDAKDEADAAERDSRAALITDLQKSVKKTAKKDVTLGILTGPILDVTCTPLGGGSSDDLTQKSATMECFAANKKNDDGTENGYTFNATVNWTTSEYTWRLGS